MKTGDAGMRIGWILSALDYNSFLVNCCTIIPPTINANPIIVENKIFSPTINCIIINDKKGDK